MASNHGSGCSRSSGRRFCALRSAWRYFAQIATRRKEVSMDTLTPLQKAQGKIEKKGLRRECPVHHVFGRITDWAPPPGIDPNMKEFQCPISKHAFYEVIRQTRKP